jgi:hypothetical protein
MPTEPSLSLARPMYWVMGFVSFFLETVLTPPEVRQRQAQRQWKRQWRRWVRQGALTGDKSAHRAPASGLPALSALRAALLGRDRAYIVATLGPPPATSAAPQVQSLPPQPAHYWHADVWYYPMDLHRRHAIAFIFQNDVISAIEPLTGPR